MNSLYLLLICLPLKHIELSSGFGYRIHPITGRYQMHAGVDLRAKHDTVFSICSGMATIGYNSLLGINLTVRSTAISCTYGHLSQILAAGQVNAGDPIAITGATGRVTGEHLHLSIACGGQYLDPIKFLYQLIIATHE